MITVRYYYSACVGIETPNLSVLCDPWFTDGAYDGSWYQYPKLKNPLEIIPEYEYIYISHIHPDHYDPIFLKAYLTKHPSTKVIIGEFETNFLSQKMKADGIPHKIYGCLQKERTALKIFPNASNPHDVDSALVVKFDNHSVVNMNDNLFNPQLVGAIKEFVGKPTIALLGYTGAGPYPQTYFVDQNVLEIKAQEKKEAFFTRYRQMRDALSPTITIPFAGKYILGGKLHELNRFRGTADAVEVTDFDSSAVVLADGGHAYINTHDLKASHIRTEKYDLAFQESYLQEVSTKPLTYETYFSGLSNSAIPLRRLLPKAYANAITRSRCKEDYFVCIPIQQGWFVCNIREDSNTFQFESSVQEITPRSEIHIDLRYLFGLITCIFHWNNAEVGSQYRTHRVPDIFNREVQGFFNFFHV